MFVVDGVGMLDLTLVLSGFRRRKFIWISRKCWEMLFYVKSALKCCTAELLSKLMVRQLDENHGRSWIQMVCGFLYGHCPRRMCSSSASDSSAT